jgi:UDP-glucose 4-epimerase
VQRTPPRSSIGVLGGFGFIGSAVCRTLLARGHRVVAFGRADGLCRARFERSDRLTIRTGEVERPDAVMGAIADCDVVVDLVHLRGCGPESELATATAAARWMARLGETPVAHLLYVSSGGSVYGASSSLPIDETSPLAPCSPYGRAKRAGERQATRSCAAAGVHLTIVRPSNVYGPGQTPTEGRGVVPVMVGRALRGQALEVWGDGGAIRDYLYVDDMARAVAQLVDPRGPIRIFNVGSERGVTLHELVARLSGLLGRPLRLDHRPPPSSMVPANVLDCGRMRRETGWRPTVPIQEGLGRTVRWLAGGPGARRAAMLGAEPAARAVRPSEPEPRL